MKNTKEKASFVSARTICSGVAATAAAIAIIIGIIVVSFFEKAVARYVLPLALIAIISLLVFGFLCSKEDSEITVSGNEETTGVNQHI